MARLWFAIVIVIVIGVVYTLVDVVVIDRSRIRGVPRGIWVVIVLLFPIIGSFLWFTVGKERRQPKKKKITRVIPPDDDPEFLSRLSKQYGRSSRIGRDEPDELDKCDEPDEESDGPEHTDRRMDLS